MDFLPDIAAIQGAIMTFSTASASNLLAPARALMSTAIKVSPRDTIVNIAELLYANQDNMNDPAARAAAQTLCGQCAAFAGSFGWMDTRGGQIVSAMRRDLGETAPAGAPWPDPSTDPPPLAAWRSAV